MSRPKTIRILLASHASFSGGGQAWVSIMCRHLPKSVVPYVLFTRIGHPGNIFWHRLQPWLAPFNLQYKKHEPDWPKRVAEFIDKERISVLIQEEDERLREIVAACAVKPRVIYVKHVMDRRMDISQNEAIIDEVVSVSEKVWTTVKRGVVIRNGVPPPEAAGLPVRSIFGIKPDEFVIGYMGRIDPNKNAGFVASLAEKMGCRALIVGKQDEPLRQSAAVTVPTDVYYTGDFYKAMDCFVLPSRSEGFPLAPMEALLCGTSVAMTGVSDYPTVFADAVGFFNPGDLNGAAEAVNNAPPAAVGQAIIAESLTPEKMVEQYVNVIRGT